MSNKNKTISPVPMYRRNCPTNCPVECTKLLPTKNAKFDFGAVQTLESKIGKRPETTHKTKKIENERCENVQMLLILKKSAT